MCLRSKVKLRCSTLCTGWIFIEVHSCKVSFIRKVFDVSSWPQTPKHLWKRCTLRSQAPSILQQFFSHLLSQFQPDVTKLHLGLSVWMKGRWKLCQIRYSWTLSGIISSCSLVLLDTNQWKSCSLIRRQPPSSCWCWLEMQKKHFHSIHQWYKGEDTQVMAKI